MKRFLPLLSLLSLCATAPAEEADDIIILDEAGVKNLSIETVVAEESAFSRTVFTLGHIETISGKSGVVSSRIPGRIVELKVAPGDRIETGTEVAKIESRQPGDPPPVIVLKAPLGGTVTGVEIRLGEPVEPDRALVEIIDLSEVHAIARVPDHQAAQLAPGSKAEIRVDALADHVFDGELLRFGVAADRESGTVEAIFRLANTDGLLRPGMRAGFSIKTGMRENVLSVPREAIQGSGANRFVFVKHFDLPNAFVKAPVVVGERNEHSVEILSGIFPADEVVTRGAYSLSFAGTGSVSLKEAMDAAHGHAHNEDGSEIGEHPAGEEDHDHEHSHEGEGPDTLTVFLAITSGVLFLLLLASPFLFRARAGA